MGEFVVIVDHSDDDGQNVSIDSCRESTSGSFDICIVLFWRHVGVRYNQSRHREQAIILGLFRSRQGPQSYSVP